METVYFAETMFDGSCFQANQYISVDDGIIKDVSSNYPASAVVELNGILCPGFIDIQVNGGGGKLFNNAPSKNTLCIISEAHQNFGTTSFFPTLISDSFSVMQDAAAAVAETVPDSTTNVLGIHFEGPFLSELKKGIHPAGQLRPVSDKELSLFCRSDIGQVIVTLAPESVSPSVITDLVSQNVIVCLGHSCAQPDSVFAALEAGATGFTHLYNAMSPLTSRAPGVVGAALADRSSYCGLIVDLHHVDAVACRAAINAKTDEKIMLVTDAMFHLGSHSEILDYGGNKITHLGNKLTTADGTLAGSALDMATAIVNCHKALDLPLASALKMATSTPARFLNRDKQIGVIQAGSDANMVLLDEDLKVENSWVQGREFSTQKETD